ncbi:MAG: NAD(P)/FAD-dependent oxidoreductase [Candidatus Methanoperedens sp.]|nr:NAD(P)/FAD-dependent oxidoreductase [Candidatus Methanoperedens sp.]
MIKKDVIIIGAGASGLMCAIESGKRGRSVLVLDHASKIGKKISISGGGRCNFTNINTSHTNYISNNPHFCKSALSRFKPRYIITMLEKHGIKYEEREEGQLFCAGSSQEILLMLEKECNDAGVKIMLDCRVNEVKKINRADHADLNGQVEPIEPEDHFIISTDQEIFECESLVIATGGLAYPQIGASGLGYEIAKKFDLNVTATRPALVPFIFSKEDMKIFGELSGISINASIRCRTMSFRGSVLFTHRGLSGPAILQISSYWKEGDVIVIDLLPDTDIFRFFVEKQQNKSKTEMHNLLCEFLPTRLSKNWCDLNIQSKPVNQYNEKELRKIALQVHTWEIRPRTTEDYRTAEVTLGGIDTKELSSKTMEAIKVKGLYFTGEVVDVTGQLGGYNLHWAWASGFVAGQYV